MTWLLKETSVLLTGFSIVFFSGFLLANSILISASFIPLFIYFMGIFMGDPKVQIKRIDYLSTAKLGEIIEVRIAGKITGGPGAVVVYDDIPEVFQLVEGTNYKVVSKKFKEEEFSVSYKILCTKCGNHRLGLGYQAKHILGLASTQASIGEPRQIRVLPVFPKIRRMKSPQRWTRRMYPTGSVAKTGPLTTDFKEIRNYFYGDPFKIINWKASARAAGWGKLYPLVNEYEREGKLSIWLFLDASPNLRIGTSIENALEYGIWAAHTISYYFLNKGHSFGMYIYNHQGETVYSDTGKKQFIKIADRLLTLNPSKVGLHVYWDEGFSKAVSKNQKYLISQSPKIVIITHVTSSNYNDLLDGTKKILAYKRRSQPNIMLINILPYDIIPKDSDWEIFAAEMLELASRSASDRLRALGLTVLDWVPKKEGIESALLSAMRVR